MANEKAPNWTDERDRVLRGNDADDLPFLQVAVLQEIAYQLRRIANHLEDGH